MVQETVDSLAGGGALDWEWLWSPYDDAAYDAVLAAVRTDDVVLEIGAGDLRLARRLAAKARRVVAVERRAALLPAAETLPPTLTVVAGDARTLPFPAETTVAVLLMRHCRHVARYWRKLAATACTRLITNARWGLDPEVIALRQPRRPFATLAMGWYACRCGATGFRPGPSERLTLALAARVHEVRDCPRCPEAPPW